MAEPTEPKTEEKQGVIFDILDPPDEARKQPNRPPLSIYAKITFHVMMGLVVGTFILYVLSFTLEKVLPDTAVLSALFSTLLEVLKFIALM